MTEDIKKALDILNEGGTILYPTDTIWGIGCDATNENAVKKVYKIKNRTDTKSMLILVENYSMLKDYIEQIPSKATEILASEKKPITIIYPGARNLAENLIASDRSIGIRVVRDEFCLKLIHQFKKAIVSTSANISGKPAPKNFNEIDTEIIKSVDYVVKWRQDDFSQNNPSGIIKIGVNDEVEVIRK
jgi:L-threonylcarbamoyladenylate synthase